MQLISAIQRFCEIFFLRKWPFESILLAKLSSIAMIPSKRILTDKDVKIWEESETREDILSFIESLAKAVEGFENDQVSEPVSDSVQSTIAVLTEIDKLIKLHPVIQDKNTSRFGKVEFRDFYDDVCEKADDLLSSHFPALTSEQIEQLSIYLQESWGNKRRIDYGSGHELNFICFLYGLTHYKIFDLQRDARNLVLVLFIEYLKIMREIETLYWLEPAGSHGVWGLDDYHFLPFLFGAFQLAPHKHLKPKSIHNEELVEMFADKYLYFGCIAFINSVKTSTSLRWHSPMLDDISGVKKWSKVAEGMIKMYKAEVLGKLPIMQHFYFSEFLVCPEGISEPRTHIHNGDEGDDQCCQDGAAHNTWGDCCGIKIPSLYAANAMEKQSHKPIPFD